jgi:hypothetical protein
MERPKVERLTKIETATRQLETAITLFFNGGDSVSIHTLTAAAYEVLRDVCRPRGIFSHTKDSPYIRPEKRKEAMSIFNKAQNFFKHAQKDPDAIFDFKAEATSFLIIDAIELYSRLTGSLFAAANVFRMWFALKYPDLIMGPFHALVIEARKQEIDPEDFELMSKLLEIKKREERG